MLNKRTAVAALTVLFPVAALADLSGTVTLSSNTFLSLDTGTIVTTGGDFNWTGSSLSPHGTAKAFNATTVFTESGPTGFAFFTQATLAKLVPVLGSNLPLNSLAVNNVICALTNGNNYAAILVTSIGNGSITLQYATFGVSSATPPPPTGPTITQIQNNYSYILPGLPNYGIAPGTLFIIQGTNLASATNAVVQSSAGSGIPTALNGASIAVTVNGVTTHPGMYYATSTQIAAVLPSSTPVGTGTVAVTYNGTTSAAAPITVLQSALGFDTYGGTGYGLGVATDPLTGSLFSYNQSAKPGQTIVLWGSGLGADTADSDTVATATPHAVSVPLTIYIGGAQAQVLYQGSSGYPGVNQLNVTIPTSVPTGCSVSVIAVSGTIASNAVTIPIDPSGGVCSDPYLSIDGNAILTENGKSRVTSGNLVINQVNGANDAGAVFITSANLQSNFGVNITSGLSLGNCVTSFAKVTTTTIPTPSGPDAGTISITGPTGTVALPSVLAANGGSSGVYNSALQPSFIPVTGGTYTFTGAGGTDIGPFTASVSSPSLLNWTNRTSITSITRAQGLNLTWTGGPANSYILIGGTSLAGSVYGSFSCAVSASAGQFTVPAYILNALPAGTGSLSMTNEVDVTPFTASGMDIGRANFGVSYSMTPSFN